MSKCWFYSVLIRLWFFLYRAHGTPQKFRGFELLCCPCFHSSLISLDNFSVCERYFNGRLEHFVPTFVWFVSVTSRVCPFRLSALTLLGQKTKALTTSGNRSKKSGRESGGYVDAVRVVVKRWEQAAELSTCQPTQTLLLLCYCWFSEAIQLIFWASIVSKAKKHAIVLVFCDLNIFIRDSKRCGEL